MRSNTERVDFRLIQMPCCQYLFCNVNARFPSYCPNCGKSVYPLVKSGVLIHDNQAILKYKSEET